MYRGGDIVEKGSCKPLVYKNIVKHTFAAGDKIKLENEGAEPLGFYLAPQKDDKPVGKLLIVQPAKRQPWAWKNWVKSPTPS